MAIFLFGMLLLECAIAPVIGANVGTTMNDHRRAHLEFPTMMETSMRKEASHPQANATELVAHGLNRHQHDLREGDDCAASVAASIEPLELNIEETKEARVMTLHSAVFECATRAATKTSPGP